MNINALKLAASALAVGAVFASGASASNKGSEAADAGQAEMMKVASTAAGVARSAMAAKKSSLAVTHAEKAVAAMPHDASYRMLLGEAYLFAGRFASAETAFVDTLALDNAHVRAALKLSLARSAQGKNAEAVEVLEAHRDQLAAADYGLAMTLAGDPGSAIPVLDAAARGVDATAKIRQNLAFAHAMSNNWAAARTIAGQDLSPDMVTKRIVEWAALSRPQTAADQVAGILGVKPAFDPGQPVALALGVVAPREEMLAVAEQPVTPMEVASAAPAVSVPLEETVAAAPVVAGDPLPVVQNTQQIVFGPRSPVVQPIPQRVATAPLIRANLSPTKQAVVAHASAKGTKVTQSGRYVVQLGAYSSAKRAEAGWNRLSRQMTHLGSYDPQTARIRVKSASLFRLSVTGFAARDDAGRVCASIKAAGAECFIRSVAGDSPLRWALRTPTGGTRIASARR